MKKRIILPVLLVAFFALILSSCNPNNNSADSTSQSTLEGTIVINYNYKDKNVNSIKYAIDGVEQTTGYTFTITNDSTSASVNMSVISLLVKNENNTDYVQQTWTVNAYDLSHNPSLGLFF